MALMVTRLISHLPGLRAKAHESARERAVPFPTRPTYSNDPLQRAGLIPQHSERIFLKLLDESNTRLSLGAS
jgi:hypothetical protein